MKSRYESYFRHNRQSPPQRDMSLVVAEVADDERRFGPNLFQVHRRARLVRSAALIPARTMSWNGVVMTSRTQATRKTAWATPRASRRSWKYVSIDARGVAHAVLRINVRNHSLGMAGACLADFGKNSSRSACDRSRSRDGKGIVPLRRAANKTAATRSADVPGLSRCPSLRSHRSSSSNLDQLA